MTKYMAVLASAFVGLVAGAMMQCPACGLLPATVMVVGASVGLALQLENEDRS